MNNLKISIALFAVIFLLSACFKQNKDGNDSSEGTKLELDSVVQILPNEALQAFTVFVQTTDSTPENMLIVANRFKELFATESTLVVDSAIIKFEKFYQKVEANLNEKMMNDTTDYSVIWTGEPVPTSIKNFQKSLKDNGLDRKSVV